MPDDDIGIGPKSIAPGGFNGIRTSSPYDDPLTCQNPTWGVNAKTKKHPLRHNVTMPSRDAGDSIAPPNNDDDVHSRQDTKGSE